MVPQPDSADGHEVPGTVQQLPAAAALSEHLRGLYPERGFKLHPSIGFHTDEDGGVCVRANADVAAGESAPRRLDPVSSG